MADQLVTLGLDEKEYQQGLKQLMRQSRGEFAKMRGDVQRTSSFIAKAGFGLVAFKGANKAIAIMNSSINEYAQSSARAGREVEAALRPWRTFKQELGSQLVPLLSWVSNAATTIGDEVTAIIAALSGGSYSEMIGALEDQHKAQAKSEEMEKKRTHELREQLATMRLQAQLFRAQGDRNRAGGGELNARLYDISADRLESLEELRSLSGDGLSREEFETRLELVQAIADESRVTAERTARREEIERQHREREDILSRMEQEANRIEGERREREDALDELRGEEVALRASILRELGQGRDADRMLMREELAERLRGIETRRGLTDDEKEAAAMRLRGLYGRLEEARGLRPESDSLASIAGGSAGLGSVIAGTFGRDLMGGRNGAQSALEKIREQSTATAANTARTAQLLATIATKIGPAVYG